MSMRAFSHLAQISVIAFFEAVARSHEALFEAWAEIESDSDPSGQSPAVNVYKIDVPDFIDAEEGELEV